MKIGRQMIETCTLQEARRDAGPKAVERVAGAELACHVVGGDQLESVVSGEGYQPSIHSSRSGSGRPTGRMEARPAEPAADELGGAVRAWHGGPASRRETAFVSDAAGLVRSPRGLAGGQAPAT
jgi:hypothetical protein